MFSPAPDDDDDDFIPTSSSKLSSLFGGEASGKGASLKYVAPKQPRGDGDPAAQAAPAATPAAPAATPAAPTVLLAAPVTAYLFVSGSAQSQGRAMCCVVASLGDNTHQLLVYRSKQDHLTRARIHQHFTFNVQPNNYVNFNDDQQRSWSLMIDPSSYADFVIQVGVCRALVDGGEGVVCVQDVTGGEGPRLQEGDQAQVSFSVWGVAEGKRGAQIDGGKSGARVKLKEGCKTWESGLVGAQRNTRRLVFVRHAQDNKSLMFYDLRVERVKQRGSEQSGRNTPQQEAGPLQRNGSTSTVALNALPEDPAGGVDGSASRASLVSRMARVGQALLPRPNAAHTPVTDSESEVEEICRRRQYTGGSVSAEELPAAPGLRSRASTGLGEAPRPDLAPKPNVASPQQLVVYQSPHWNHQPFPGYQVAAPAMHTPPQQPPQPDPTLALLFSESRAQGTDVKITLAKLTDKIDNITNKLEKLENDKTSLASAGLSVARVTNSSPDPHALLHDITAIVTLNVDLKAELGGKDKKILALNENVTELLQKNQKLLEEKAEFLSAKQDDQQVNMKFEVTQLKNENSELKTKLSLVQEEFSTLQGDLKNTKHSIKEKEEEISTLRETIDEQEKMKREMQTDLEENKIEADRLKEELAKLQQEKVKMKDLLRDAETGKDQLQQQLEEVARVSLPEDTGKESRDQEHQEIKAETEALKNELQSALQKIEELKKECDALKQQAAETEKETSVMYEGKISKLENEKVALENELKAAKESEGGTSQDVVATVKKVMNTVFRTLKPHFHDADTYHGKFVLDTLLAVIRDTTLQLLAQVEEKTVAPDESRDGGNNKGDGRAGDNGGPQSCSLSNALEQASHSRVLAPRENIVLKNEGENYISNANVHNGADESEESNKHSNSSIESQIISDKVKTIVEDNHDTFPKTILSDIDESKAASEQDRCRSENNGAIVAACQSLDERTPVIDMENTEVRTIASEKSDSSRDSSLDRAWRPQPPPPPLFSDEEDDEDWLS